MSSRIPGVGDVARLERAWKRVARETGGRFGRTGFGGSPVMEIPMGKTHALFDLRGSDFGAFTRARVPFHSAEGFSFGLSDEGRVASFFKSLGFVQNIVIGHEAFD